VVLGADRSTEVEICFVVLIRSPELFGGATNYDCVESQSIANRRCHDEVSLEALLQVAGAI
jgi:hypothetical protein